MKATHAPPQTQQTHKDTLTPTCTRTYPHRNARARSRALALSNPTQPHQPTDRPTHSPTHPPPHLHPPGPELSQRKCREGHTSYTQRPPHDAAYASRCDLRCGFSTFMHTFIDPLRTPLNAHPSMHTPPFTPPRSPPLSYSPLPPISPRYSPEADACLRADGHGRPSIKHFMHPP